MMQTAHLVEFLTRELGLSPRSIAMARRRQEEVVGPLPMILFELGLISLPELEYVLEWTWAV
jgi:Protein of unknown function (DUF2949)